MSADNPQPEAVEPGSADLLDEVARHIDFLEAHADPAVRDHLAALLDHVDRIHRAALTHLVEAIRGMAGQAFLNRLIADPAIRLLLMSYDLIAVDRRILAEEALDAVRGPLHAHGIDIELLDVVGGVVYVRLHGLDADDPAEAVRARIEAALRDGFVGFQQLEIGPRTASSGLIQLSGQRPLRRPVYRRAADVAELREGELKAVDLDGHPVLIVRLGGDVFALRNRCGESPLPLEFGRLEGDVLTCPWHGCRWNVRTGRPLDEHAEPLTVLPARCDAGVVLVAVATEAVA